MTSVASTLSYKVLTLSKINHKDEKMTSIHVFFKKHKFKKHEAQNTEILRNI